MAEPSSPGQQLAAPSIFGASEPQASSASAPVESQDSPSSAAVATSSSLALPAPAPAPTPTSAASTSNTHIMPNSPLKARPISAGYRPKITRTLGQRPACLVNASVTYCGNNQIYAFGGFDQYTDEVYNHVLRLDLATYQWNLVDNYGDIPGVRMGHTATLYQGDKLLVFGGENENRSYLSDLIVFDLKTTHWTQPQVAGPIPKGRARHAAVLNEDKLFIIGGITGQNNYPLDDICYLDLHTYTWSKAWRFVGRFDHSATIWGNRVWVFGGLSEDMDKISDLWWLDLQGSPEFDSRPHYGFFDRHSSASRLSAPPPPPYSMGPPLAVGASGYAANSRTAQVNTPSFQLKTYAPMAPGSISSVKFISGSTIPSQGSGIHYHAYASGMLLDFVTPAATIAPRECLLSALDLGTLRWQKLAEGSDIFKPGYRWHYCTMNEDGTKAWLLGCPTDLIAADLGPNGYEEYLSDIMEIDLRRYGFLGNNATPELRTESRPCATTRTVDSPSKGLGADLAKLFDQPPESGSGTDFIVTALAEDSAEDDVFEGGRGEAGEECDDQTWLAADAPTSQSIHVHRLILQARWPHFARLYNSEMAEFHTKRMHVPEPYSVVRAFLMYLYTDNISGSVEPGNEATTMELSDVAGLLVLSNMYNLPHLRLLCVNRLAKELDVEHACVIWRASGLAGEEWLRKRAGGFCMTHWGRIVRTSGFRGLPRSALVELSQEVDMEGRVVPGEELEWGGRYGELAHAPRKMSVSGSSQTQMQESEVDDEDGMEMS